METPIEWVKRFRQKYNRFPNPNFFRYAPPKKVYKRAGSGILQRSRSGSMKGKEFDTGKIEP